MSFILVEPLPHLNQAYYKWIEEKKQNKTNKNFHCVAWHVFIPVQTHMHTHSLSLLLMPFTSMCLCSSAVCLCNFMMGHFFTSRAPKRVWLGFDSSHGYTGREPDSGPIVMNSLLKLWSTAPTLFFSPPPDSPHSLPLSLPHHSSCVMDWFAATERQRH